MKHDEYTEGFTAPIQYDLLNDNATFNATGMTPGLILKDCNGNVITVTGTVSWANQLASRIEFVPGTGDFKAALSPYTLHWTVTDSNGKIATYPQGEPILIDIYPQ